MKFELFMYVTLCLLSLYTGDMSTATENPTRRLQRHGSDPPAHTELVAMARYTLHNAGWASIATVSALPAIEGLPFSNVKPIADGYIANSTGIPYFYMSPDLTAKDLLKDNHATVLVSSEETMFCGNQLWDPEDHQSTRLMLTGIMKKVEEGTPEYTFAKGGLFERHPVIANFSADHDWVVAKLSIEQIAIVDYSGGTEYIPVKDYLAYNYTQTAVTRRTKRQEGNLGSIVVNTVNSPNSQIAKRQEGNLGSIVVNTVNSPNSQILFNRDQLGKLLGSFVFRTVNSPSSYIELNLQFTPISQINVQQSSTVITTLNSRGNIKMNRIYVPNMSIVCSTINSPQTRIVLTLQVPT